MENGKQEMKVPRNRSEKIRLMRNRMREMKAIIYETLHVKLDEKRKKSFKTIIKTIWMKNITYIFRNINRTIE